MLPKCSIKYKENVEALNTKSTSWEYTNLDEILSKAMAIGSKWRNKKENNSKKKNYIKILVLKDLDISHDETIDFEAVKTMVNQANVEKRSFGMIKWIFCQKFFLKIFFLTH